MSAVGIIFSGIHDHNLPEITKKRTLGSVPFGGRYRLIDFVLSNMVNSGITSVGVIARNNYQSLLSHLGSGKEWDLSRKFGGLAVFPPYSFSNGSGHGAAVQVLEPNLGVLLLVGGRLLEEGGYLHKSVLLRLRCIVSVFVAGHRLAGERLLQVAFGFCSFQICHSVEV